MSSTAAPGGIAEQKGRHDTAPVPAAANFLDAGGPFRVKSHHMRGSNGNGTTLACPNSLSLASDGTLYGTTYGGSFICGNDLGGKSVGGVFTLSPPETPGGEWAYKALYAFSGDVGADPNTSLIADGDAWIFGVQTGTEGYLLELQPPSTTGGAWTTIPLHEFTSYELPQGQMVLDVQGRLFGIQASEAPPYEPFTGSVYMVTGIP
jgi:hypothetical protein